MNCDRQNKEKIAFIQKMWQGDVGGRSQIITPASTLAQRAITGDSILFVLKITQA